MPEPLKTRVRLVKLSGLAARIAIGSWDSWDEVAILPRGIAEELQLESIESVIRDTRQNMEGSVVNGEIGRTSELTDCSRPPIRKLSYYDAASDPFDGINGAVSSMHIDLVPFKSPAKPRKNLLVNGCGVRSKAALAMVEGCPDAIVSVVCSASDAEFYQAVKHRIALPSSYGALNAAVNSLVE